MRFRIRGPAGTHTVTLADDATVNDFCVKVTELTELIVFDLKAGFPPKPLDISQFSSDTKLSDTGFRFNGEQIIVAQKDLPGVTFARPTAAHSASMTNEPQKTDTTKTTPASSSKNEPSKPKSKTQGLLSLNRKKQSEMESDPPSVRIPARGGSLVLRVMPDDNSCLFRALSSCLLGASLDGMTELRSVVAQAIAADAATYSDAVLQQPRDQYCAWIQQEDSWGGYVDIKAIAENFGTEVVSIDVQSGLVTRYCEGAPLRCFVVYSGIHYDALAFMPDGVGGVLETEFDQKQFEAQDDTFLDAAREIGRRLKERKYFTDTAGFSIKCGVCGWTGKGEKGATEHAKKTGHMDFSEG